MSPPRELTDDYRLDRILGSSRGGSILRASAIATGQTVVIKLINLAAPADPSLAARLAARFDAYVAALAGLRHPNLPAVLDAGMTSDGSAFLVMEMLDGTDFEAEAASPPAPGSGGAAPDRILPLLSQALAGLEELARHGLAHLNLCPENLFLVPLAPLVPPAPLAQDTAVGAGADSVPADAGTPAAQPATVKLLGLGTPLFHLGEAWPDAEGARFRAPELASPAAASTATLDWRADIYSLALTACYALGATVAIGEDGGKLVQTVQMPLALRFELANDEALRQILERCLRQSPGERPAHGAIRDAFGLALGGTAFPAGLLEPLSQPMAAPRQREESAFAGFFAPGADTGPEEHREHPDPRRQPWQQDRWAQPEAPAEPVAPANPVGQVATRRSGEPGPAAHPEHPEYPAHLSVTAQPSPTAGGEDADPFFDLFDVPDLLPTLAEADEPALSAAAPAAGDDGWAAAEPPALATASAPPPAAPAGAWTAAATTSAGPAGRTAAPRAGGPVSPATSVGGYLAGAAVAAGLAGAGKAAAGAAPTPRPGPGGAKAPSGGLAPKPTGAEPPGEMLSAVDDLLSSLPPPPPALTPPPPAQRGGLGAGFGAKGAKTTAPAPAARRGDEPVAAAAGARPAGWRLPGPLRELPRPALLATGGGLLLAAGLAAWVLVGHGWRHAPPSGTGAAGAPESGGDAAASSPQRPGRSAAAKFDDAKSYLIFGKESDGRVRQALHELTFADQAELGPEACQQLTAIQQMLAVSGLETVQQDLATGLRNGDLGVLESVVEVASPGDLPPNQQSDLARARNLVEQYRLARAAATRGDPAEVLERCRAMAGLARTLHDPLDLRDQAARAIETDAAGLARDGNYDQAVSRLDPIVRSWPERAGVKDLVKSYQTAAANELRQQAILDSVPAYESRRRPSDALDLLGPLQPTPHLAQRIAEARQRLQTELAQLDAEPPQVTLRPGYVLDYSRGTTVTLSFRVTDDYQVKSVKLFARFESGSKRELPLQKSGFGWDVEIPASVHQNGTVDLWVVATDLSGHEGVLGTKDNPLKLTRRKGFEQLLH
ncbi:MAG TPA: hypothetical protein VKY89_12330 [Thermoanaerobaculia bacterium]|jgi:serine/threonine protein kinase|nr:hypothetical protein [Thermoanaerobaculia bacterium]